MAERRDGGGGGRRPRRERRPAREATRPLRRRTRAEPPAALAAAAAPTPIDLLDGPKRALTGRVVTMDESFTVIPKGVVWIDGGAIAAVGAQGDPPPVGFEDVKLVATASMAHRLILSGGADLHAGSALVRSVMERVPVPRG